MPPAPRDFALDSRIVQRCQNGDLAAFDLLVERHKNDVFSLIYRMTNDRDRAEDITVEVLLRVFHSLAGLRRGASFAAWLHRLAVNCCSNALRQLRRHAEARELLRRQVQLMPSPASFEAVLEERVAANLVREALLALPETQRLVVIMSHMDGLPCAEGAEILGISQGAVKARLHRATCALRDRLRADGLLELRGGATIAPSDGSFTQPGRTFVIEARNT